MKPQVKRVIAIMIAVLVGIMGLYLLIPDPASDHGHNPTVVYQDQVTGLKAACTEYRADFNADPPIGNPEFFDALAGQNRLNKLYVQIRTKRDANGQILDPWGAPYIVTVKNGNIEIYSNSVK